MQTACLKVLKPDYARFYSFHSATIKSIEKNIESPIPICSMYAIFTNIYPINYPNVGKYTIHGAYGL